MVQFKLCAKHAEVAKDIEGIFCPQCEADKCFKEKVKKFADRIQTEKEAFSQVEAELFVITHAAKRMEKKLIEQREKVDTHLQDARELLWRLEKGVHEFLVQEGE